MAILVVEDERLINLMATEELKWSGYVVISAFDADDAFEILRCRDDVQVVFTDIDMPGTMDGLRLAAAIREKWPPVHIIITRENIGRVTTRCQPTRIHCQALRD